VIFGTGKLHTTRSGVMQILSKFCHKLTNVYFWPLLKWRRLFRWRASLRHRRQLLGALQIFSSLYNLLLTYLHTYCFWIIVLSLMILTDQLITPSTASSATVDCRTCACEKSWN